jgi:hypothetical protein
VDFQLATRPRIHSEEQLSELRKASDYRIFLKTYLELFDYSLSDFARATGFGRGFPGDVISGKRRLSAKSSHAFEKALKLPIKGKKLFRFLVAREETDLYPEIDRTKVAVEIENLQEQPWRRQRTEIQEGHGLSFKTSSLDKNKLAVYAASGDLETGATYQEIQQRTGFSKAEILKYIEELEKLNLIEIRDSVRVIPKDIHVFLKITNQNTLLTQTFIQSIEMAKKAIGNQDRTNDEFFFNSSFCIKKDKLPELKAELRETVLKYIDDSIDSSGDGIAHLLLALHL